MDSLNQNLMLPTQGKLLRIGWNDTVRRYCDEIGIDRNDIVPAVERKIRINELRNPREAFMLVAGEDLQNSKRRMEHNWLMLKKKRVETNGRPMRQDRWKKSLYIDQGGWVRESEKTN